MCESFLMKCFAQPCFPLSKAFPGTMMSSDLVWELTDMANYLMVLPNVIGLVAGSAMVVALLKEGKAIKAKN